MLHIFYKLSLTKEKETNSELMYYFFISGNYIIRP